MRAYLGVSWLAFTLLTSLAASAQTPPLEVYGRMPAVEQVALSSSGNHIALLAQVKNTRGVVIVGSDNKVQRTFATGDLKIDSLTWAGDDLLLMKHCEYRCARNWIHRRQSRIDFNDGPVGE